jgi:hypothetical protein
VLVIPAAGAEGLKSLHLGLDVVGLQVEVHPFLATRGPVVALWRTRRPNEWDWASTLTTGDGGSDIGSDLRSVPVAVAPTGSGDLVTRG